SDRRAGKHAQEDPGDYGSYTNREFCSHLRRTRSIGRVGRYCRGGPPWPPLRLNSAQGRPRRAAPTVMTTVPTTFLLLLILAVPSLAQTGTWARQRSGTMSWLHAVFFLDQNRGWAVGSKGALLQTSDGGNTWTTRTGAT